jgi:hypothetical protein
VVVVVVVVWVEVVRDDVVCVVVVVVVCFVVVWVACGLGLALCDLGLALADLALCGFAFALAVCAAAVVVDEVGRDAVVPDVLDDPPQPARTRASAMAPRSARLIPFLAILDQGGLRPRSNSSRTLSSGPCISVS